MSKLIQFVDSLKTKIYSVPYYPVGSVFITVENTNPTKWFGGTWTSFGSGRTLVGVDTSQSEFNTVLKTGGNKNTQKHTHVINFNVAKNDSVNQGSCYIDDSERFIMAGNHLKNVDVGFDHGESRMSVSQFGNTDAKPVSTEYGTGDSQNLQPYITVYFWRKTAM